MAKKTKTVEYDDCDFCDSDEDCYTKCLGCGRDVCYECKKNKGTEYQYALHVSGSNNGYYCAECDKEPRDSLHRAYRDMLALIEESVVFSSGLRSRGDVIEKRILAEKSKRRKNQ